MVKFPKRLYVRREHDPSDKKAVYFIAQEITAGLVQPDDEEEIGIYGLMTTGKATAPTIITAKKR